MGRIEEMSIQDIAFLYGCSNPTVVIIHQDAHGRHVKAHEISLRDKEFAKVSFRMMFPGSSLTDCHSLSSDVLEAR